MSTNRPPAETPAERRQRLLGVLRDLGGEASPGELVAASHIPARTVTRDLAALVEQGLLTGSEKLRQLSAAGWEQLNAEVVPMPASSFEEAVREVFGPYHCAFIRLLADAVVARSLWPQRSWAPGFVACGSPGRGKSAVADVMCWAFGLDRVEAVRQSDQLAPGEVVGRRRQLPGGRMVLETSAIVRLPFVCLDEWAAASPEVKREALKLVHGETVALVEDERVELRPTTLLTYNPLPRGDCRAPLPEAYWRRCIVLNVDGVPDDPGLAGRLQHFYAQCRPPALRLEKLHAVVGEVPGELRAQFVSDRGFRRALTDAGRLCYGDIRTAETLVLGRMGRFGLGEADDLRAVVLHVVYDLLTVAETVPGQVDPTWRLDADATRRDLAGSPGAVELVDTVNHHEQARRAREMAGAERARRSAEQDLALVGRRAEMAQGFTDAAKAIERVPGALRPRAAGIRKQLRTLAQKAADARSASALDSLVDLASPMVQAAEDLRAEMLEAASEARRIAQEQKDRQRQQAEAARALDRQLQERAKITDKQNKAQALAVKRHVAALHALARRKTTRPEENVLGRLVECHVLVGFDEVFETDARSAIERLQRRPPKIEPRTRRRYRSADGQIYAAEELRSWDAPAVRQALAGAIAAAEHRAAVRTPLAALPAPRAALGPGPGRVARGPGTAEQLYGAPP